LVDGGTWNTIAGQPTDDSEMAIAHAIRTGTGTHDLHEQIVLRANEIGADDSLMEAITGATEAPPADYVHQQGWVLIVFRNALW